MLLTLNNEQNLDPKYFKASYSVKWTVAHESAGKPQSVVIGVYVLRPVETEALAYLGERDIGRCPSQTYFWRLNVISKGT